MKISIGDEGWQRCKVVDAAGIYIRCHSFDTETKEAEIWNLTTGETEPKRLPDARLIDIRTGAEIR